MKFKSKYFIFIFLTILLEFFFIPISENIVFSFSEKSLSSERVFLEAVKNLYEAKSGEYSGNIKMNFETVDRNTFIDSFRNLFNKNKSNRSSTGDRRSYYLNLDVSFNNSFNFYDTKNKVNSSEISHYINSNIFAERFSAAFKINLINHNKNLYLKFRDFDISYKNLVFKNENLFSFINKIFKSINDQWIKFDIKELESNWEFEDFKYENLKKKSNDLYNSFSEKENVLKLIEDAYKKNALIIKKLPNQKINGVNTYHYRLIISEYKLKNLILSFYKDNLKKINDVDDGNFMKIIKQDLDNFFNRVDINNFEIWISQEDFYPYKFFIVLNIKNLKEKGNLDSNLKNGQIKILFKFKKFNQPIIIEVPKSTKPIKIIFKELEEIFLKENKSF